jgi:hypothetical protein
VTEFLEMMDVPASVIKHAFDRKKLDEACSAGLLSSPPLKVLQEVGYMLFGRDNFFLWRLSWTYLQERRCLLI